MKNTSSKQLLIERFDHMVLTVKSIQNTCDFYSRTLNMEKRTPGDGRIALHFGNQKINLYEQDDKILPKAFKPTAGSADICLITTTPIKNVIDHLHRLNVNIEAGPVKRNGALGRIISVYIRDPDHNLIELSNYIT